MAASAGTTVTLNSIIKRCVILIAMEAEAQPFVQHFNLIHEPTIFNAAAPFKCYSGKHKECDVHVVTNGKCKIYGVDHVGTVAAGISAWMALEILKPDLVINAGTAGGFGRMNAALGDVFISSGTAFHDRRIAVPVYTEWGVGALDAHPTENLRASLGYKYGVVTTSNSLDYTEEDAKHMLANNASCKDMESAALAWICQQHEIPFFCVKVITDIVDGDRPTEEEFLENLSAASIKLKETLPKILDFVVGKPVSEI